LLVSFEFLCHYCISVFIVADALGAHQVEVAYFDKELATINSFADQFDRTRPSMSAFHVKKNLDKKVKLLLG
jgi:hypothetical protein